MKFAALFLASLAVLVGKSWSQCVDLGNTANYSMFVTNNLYAKNTQIQGRIAVGNDAVLDNVWVGFNVFDGELKTCNQISKDPNLQGDLEFPECAVIVNGMLDMSASSRVFNGGVCYGQQDSQVLLGENRVAQGCKIEQTSDLSSVLDWTQQLEQASTQLSGFQTTSDYSSRYGLLTLEFNGDLDIEVFNLTSLDLAQAQIINIRGVPKEGATILINVNGTFAGFSDVNMIELSDFSNVTMWNFYEAELLIVRNVDVFGSVLAPLATVPLATGRFNGHVFVTEWGREDAPSTALVSFVPFEGNLCPPEMPAPMNN